MFNNNTKGYAGEGLPSKILPSVKLKFNCL